MKMGLKVTTVLGKRWDKQGLAHLVKPCQHQDLNLPPQVQVWWCLLVVDYVPEFSQVAPQAPVTYVCMGPRTYEHIHTYSHKKIKR